MWQPQIADTLEAHRDFMFRKYDRIGEPLNLHASGRAWLRRVYDQNRGTADGAALVLGATSWLGELLRASYRRTMLADMSHAMLGMCRADMMSAGGENDLEFIQAGWLDIPNSVRRLDLVVGDNSFSFLAYPESWQSLCETLADRMEPGAILLARCCSVPTSHRSESPNEIVERFVDEATINFTEVRARLLFSRWDPRTYAIDTEAVLATFEAHRASFDRLFRRWPAEHDNDLVTVEKYRGAGAVYFAPPLPDLLAVMGRTFDVRSVHFGPYALPEYFPLVVAVRR